MRAYIAYVEWIKNQYNAVDETLHDAIKKFRLIYMDKSWHSINRSTDIPIQS